MLLGNALRRLNFNTLFLLKFPNFKIISPGVVEHNLQRPTEKAISFILSVNKKLYFFEPKKLYWKRRKKNTAKETVSWYTGSVQGNQKNKILINSLRKDHCDYCLIFIYARIPHIINKSISNNTKPNKKVF